MTNDLNQMTTAELKRYISENRNDDEAFRAALQVLMSRPTIKMPRPDGSEESQRQIEAFFREKLGLSDQDDFDNLKATE
ncbi:hypothetical protein H6F89_18480 [Cyanobacteria bacterium FACHB-63]|nr:hypothetical protein [Cyanobacteria bacterium FACHB-63]